MSDEHSGFGAAPAPVPAREEPQNDARQKASATPYLQDEISRLTEDNAHLRGRVDQLERIAAEHRSALEAAFASIQAVAQQTMGSQQRFLAMDLAAKVKGPGEPSDVTLRNADKILSFLRVDEVGSTAAQAVPESETQH